MIGSLSPPAGPSPVTGEDRRRFRQRTAAIFPEQSIRHPIDKKRHSMPNYTFALAGIDPIKARKWQIHRDAMLIDVREDSEHAAEHIPTAHHIPLSTFEASDLPAIKGKIVVFLCKSGVRTTDFADELVVAAIDAEAVFQMTGGIDAWKAAGLPVRKGRTFERCASGVETPAA